MRGGTIALWLVLLATPARAQEPVVPWADALSWGTALANPTIAGIQAARSADPKCELGRLLISEALANAATLTLKHFIVSPRPCLGCGADGFPSGHTGNSAVGLSQHWTIGLSLTLATADLRHQARRHTVPQVIAGALIGTLADVAGQRLLRCRQ